MAYDRPILYIGVSFQCRPTFNIPVRLLIVTLGLMYFRIEILCMQPKYHSRYPSVLPYSIVVIVNIWQTSQLAEVNSRIYR